MSKFLRRIWRSWLYLSDPLTQVNHRPKHYGR